MTTIKNLFCSFKIDICQSQASPSLSIHLSDFFISFLFFFFAVDFCRQYESINEKNISKCDDCETWIDSWLKWKLASIFKEKEKNVFNEDFCRYFRELCLKMEPKNFKLSHIFSSKNVYFVWNLNNRLLFFHNDPDALNLYIFFLLMMPHKHKSNYAVFCFIKWKCNIFWKE